MTDYPPACNYLVGDYMWVFIYLAVVITAVIVLVTIDLFIDKKDLDQDKRRGPIKKDDD